MSVYLPPALRCSLPNCSCLPAYSTAHLLLVEYKTNVQLPPALRVHGTPVSSRTSRTRRDYSLRPLDGLFARIESASCPVRAHFVRSLVVLRGSVAVLWACEAALAASDGSRPSTCSSRRSFLELPELFELGVPLPVDLYVIII
ncbi:hypothetical protein KC352_g27 [Hortaea werneckii]|nr:hypothetical protein KC352_g27 [Hortaea werneckii]